MKYLKGLALAAVFAVTMVAIGAGSASAAELYSTGATLDASATFHASLKSSTMLMSTTDGNTIVETCTGSTFEGTTASYTGGPVTGSLESLTWSGCTFTKDTLITGMLSIASNGTVSGSGSVWTVNVGVTCRYGTGALTTLGTLKTGKIAINAVINEQEPKAFLCPDTTRWVADYEVTSPHDLAVE